MEDNLYCNSIDTRGTKNTQKLAYNQATMLAAGSLLYQVTGEERYLQETRATYNATIDLMFDVQQDRVVLNGDPIYKACGMSWLERGFILYETVSKAKGTNGTNYMHRVFSSNLSTKDGDGYYDPYFRTGAWRNESANDVLQPSGVAAAYLLAAIYTTN